MRQLRQCIWQAARLVNEQASRDGRVQLGELGVLGGVHSAGTIRARSAAAAASKRELCCCDNLDAAARRCCVIISRSTKESDERELRLILQVELEPNSPRAEGTVTPRHGLLRHSVAAAVLPARKKASLRCMQLRVHRIIKSSPCYGGGRACLRGPSSTASERFVITLATLQAQGFAVRALMAVHNSITSCPKS